MEIHDGKEDFKLILTIVIRRKDGDPLHRLGQRKTRINARLEYKSPVY